MVLRIGKQIGRYALSIYGEEMEIVSDKVKEHRGLTLILVKREGLARGWFPFDCVEKLFG